MSKFNVQNIYKVDLEYFKTIPMNDFDDSKFLDWLFYYEKNDKEKEEKLRKILKKFLYKSELDLPNNNGLISRVLVENYLKLRKKIGRAHV